MNQEKIIFTVEFGEEEIQTFAEGNFGRKLTEIELNRITQVWYEDDSVMCEKMDLLSSVIEMAIDEESDWSVIDKDYSSKQNI